jgi:hypothetical protein
MKKMVVLLFAFVIMLPMLSFAGLKAPDVLDDETINTDTPISKNAVIGVRPFSADDVEYENVDDEEMSRMKKELKGYRKVLTDRLVNSLQGYGFKAVALKGSGNGNADIIIEGKIVMVNLGSTAARVIFGFGMGQCGIGVEGSLVDAKTGEALAKFEHESTSGLDEQFNKWQMVEKEVREASDDIAEFVDKLKQQ